MAEVSARSAPRRDCRRALVSVGVAAVLGACALGGCDRGARDDPGAGAARPAAPAPAPAARPNVLLVVVDTLSARHLDAYGYDRPTAPFLSSEARQGVLFEDVTASAPFTASSVASLFTGLDGMHHGVGGHVDSLRFSRAHRTLTEAFRDAGYATVGVVTNPWLTAQRGYDQGFGVYHHRGSGHAPDRAKLLLDELAKVPAAQPWFAWLHVIDVHMPYSPSAANLNRFDPQASASLALEHFVKRPISIDTMFFEYRYSAEDIARTRALYDAAILSVDEVLRDTVGALRARPGGEGMIVVYTSDHGESLCEHGLCWSHEFALYQDLVAVPWIVRAPGRLPEGKRVATPVRAIDLAPTVAELSGVTLGGPGATTDGSSALPLVRGQPEPLPRVAFAESGPWRDRYKKNPRLFVHGDEGRWKMVRDGRWKLIAIPHQPNDPPSDELELYDLAADPGETRNVASENPEVVARLHGAMAEWVRTRRAPPPDDAPPLAVSPEEREALQSLGYAAQ